MTDELINFAVDYLSRFRDDGQYDLLTSAQHRLTLYTGYSIEELTGGHVTQSGYDDHGKVMQQRYLKIQVTLDSMQKDISMQREDDDNRNDELFDDDEQIQLDDEIETVWPERSHSNQECNCLVNTLQMAEI